MVPIMVLGQITILHAQAALRIKSETINEFDRTFPLQKYKSKSWKYKQIGLQDHDDIQL